MTPHFSIFGVIDYLFALLLQPKGVSGQKKSGGEIRK